MNDLITPIVPASQLDRVLAPVEHATGMPNVAYTDDAYFRLERRRLMETTWGCIGFASDLLKPGYVKPLRFMGLPLLMMRNREGEIGVFHNVCSHRGMQLVQAETQVGGLIRCPYHSWSYDLSGKLKATPHVGGVGQHRDERFRCEKHGLKAIRSHVWMDLVFVNLDGEAESFATHVAPLAERWREFVGSDDLDMLRRVNMGGNLEIEVDCNWKLAVENYCEAYHLPWVHPGLNTYSRLEDHYHIMFGERFAGQGSRAYNLADVAGTALPTFRRWPEDKLRLAEYIAMFPNVLLGIQADHLFAMMLEPVGPEKTVEHLRVYYVGDEAAGDAYAACRTATLESWRVVFAEDVGVVEGMQRGRHSPGFSGGAFSPVMDEPTHYFHKWAARAMGAGAAS